MMKTTFFTPLVARLTIAASLFCLADGHAATLVNNVKGYTLDEAGKRISFTNMVIEEGKVLALDVQPDNHHIDEVIDGEGKVMLPGLIDAHGHLLGLGANLLEVNLRDSKSAKHAASMVADYAFANTTQDWITGRGWNQELWSDRAFPRAQDLDNVVSDRPVFLTRVDGHAAWVNSKAMALAGITKDTPSPVGGEILKDSDGNPTGVFIDNAAALIEAYLPSASSEIYEQQLHAAGEHLLANGVTAMHDAGVNREVYDFYLKEAVEGDLPVRIYAMISATDPDLKTLLANGPIRDKEDFLSIRSVKAYGDGALGSRGAALLSPYSDAPHQHGLLLTQPQDMAPLFTTVIGAGFQLNYHAIGDKANHVALNEYEATFEKIGGNALRHRIEHAQVIAPEDLARFAELDVLPSMQPTHATSDKNMAEDRIGKDRMKGAYAWQTLLESGIPLPLGSDFPVELANPFYGLHAAVTRQDRNNQPVKGWYAHEALTLDQAFRGFTLDAAYAGHMEDTLGTLTPGKWADFILVDQDIFNIDEKDIWKTQVQATYIAGKNVYSK
ncbi:MULTISPECIES: amidohydrolase [Alteromonas]|nr:MULTISPECIES: amidohydrolase [Alteromonas]MAF70960.1 amidohydrolase [Alteromonas sp.]QPL50660.1 amidohydrolase [Alteromonas sp. B31-7]|tara:strand:+ start:19273 stop:20937 length:1665 start_codon:yes stop_codon:yes gene_type:complete